MTRIAFVAACLAMMYTAYAAVLQTPTDTTPAAVTTSTNATVTVSPAFVAAATPTAAIDAPYAPSFYQQ